jgi:hypothetical protein
VATELGNNTDHHFDYPWYQLIEDDTLEQGDFLVEFPILMLQPPFEEFLNGEGAEAKAREFNVVILTQSCDLSAGKVDNVLVCPYFPMDELAEDFDELTSKRGRGRVKRGEVSSLHMLPPCSLPGFEDKSTVVNFRQVAAVPLGLVATHVHRSNTRLRLLPPYREHLAQAFARFVMRVGLPQEFEPEEPAKKSS